MENKHQTLFHLMEFTLFTAEIQSDFQPLFQGCLKRWC